MCLLGSVDAIHNDKYIYRFPYAKGSTNIVSQGYNGTTTHKGHSKYAIDFSMKIGTKIYAALVEVGNKVSKGALIAYSGNTGYLSGPHLHFAVFKPIIPAVQKQLKSSF